jgi:uncharacterized delta-60 repeat protein
MDGKIVVAGEGKDGLNYGALILRYNNDGTLDDSFGTAGIVVHDSDILEYESLYGLTITQEGNIVAVGAAFNPYTNSDDVLILRYNTDGTLDDTFGSSGVVTYARPECNDEAYSVATHPDGKIVVTGTGITSGPNGNSGLIVLRFNSDGTPDTAFAEEGLFTYEDPKFLSSGGEALAIQSDQKILITGWGSSPYATAALTLRLIGNGFESLTLVSPNGELTLASGSTYTIKWGAPQSITTFNLKYSLDKGSTWKKIANGLTGTEYLWKVPTPSNNKAKSLVKVIGYNASGTKIGADKSDRPFSIEVVRLTSPNGGLLYVARERILIAWTTNGTKKPFTKVNLYFTSYGVNWVPIFSLDGNPGSVYWTPPSNRFPSHGPCPCLYRCKIKIVLYDKDGNIVGTDKTDGSFGICKF